MKGGKRGRKGKGKSSSSGSCGCTQRNSGDESDEDARGRVCPQKSPGISS